MGGLVPGPPADIKVRGCSSPLELALRHLVSEGSASVDSTNHMGTGVNYILNYSPYT